jgi:soluble lytic murein transglycosylase-like protein
VPAGPIPISVTLSTLADRVSAWQGHRAPEAPRGARLLFDGAIPVSRTLAVTRSIVRANPRLHPLDALILATHAAALADRTGLPYGFFCATLLQESAFDPQAVSSAGAIGIAQFTLSTADAYGVDPFDWRDAMRGSADLLARYVQAYRGTYDDPYAAALAAYNAGPGAVAYYHGIPPYPETQDYIADIYDRWARIVRDETGLRAARR